MLMLLLNVATAVVCGAACLVGSIFVLMKLGLDRYDNYEYYSQYPALYVVPGLIGLFLPSLVRWATRKRRSSDTGQDSGARVRHGENESSSV